LLALQACLLAARAAVVEIDLIFPRNDTYDPGPLMPVVFAIRNPAMAAYLEMDVISWHIRHLADLESGHSGIIHLKDANITSADPFFVTQYSPGLNGTEEGWVIDWTLPFSNCSGSNPNTKVTSNGETRYHLFSTKRGAPGPNLVQGPGSCANSTGVAINVAETLPTGLYDCAVLGSPPIVAANPCAVSVDNATAAAMLGKNCGPQTATTCLSNSGAAAQGNPILVAWLLPVLAGLVLYVAV
jgi:hypothetical protein